MNKVGAVVLCAGSVTRFGADKLELQLRGLSIWRWSTEAFLNHPSVDEVVVVTSEDKVTEYAKTYPSAKVVAGGETRQASSAAGVRALSPEVELVLIHDGARPLVSEELIDRVIEKAKTTGAAVPAVPVVDTIKEIRGTQLSTLDRTRLVAVQTPQAGRRSDLLKTYEMGQEATDDASLLEAIGIFPSLVDGDRRNLKVTTAEDFVMLGNMVADTPEIRTGFGYDIHSFSTDPNRALWLGGVKFEGAAALEGHSDADVLLHAVVDAILGAAALGDIGQLFPNDDPRWLDMASRHFLAEAGSRLREAGWDLTNIDATVVAETPKIMARSLDIRQTIAETLGIDSGRVSVKATTNEKLGALGRAEGIAATAVATIKRAYSAGGIP